MKKSVILSVILLCAGIASVSAQTKEWKPSPLKHWSLSVGASTAGAEVELATTLGHHFQLRAGVSALPYSFTAPVDMGLGEMLSEVDPEILARAGVNPYDIPNEVDLTASLDMMNYKVLMNIYPFKKAGLHLTAGFYYGNDRLLSASAQLPSEFVDAVGMVRDHKIDFELDDPLLDAALATDGAVDLYVKNSKALKPYLGLGFGRAVPRGRLRLNMDFGLLFQGAPEIGSSSPEFLDVVNEMLAEEGVGEMLGELTAYPVISLRLVWRLF